MRRFAPVVALLALLCAPRQGQADFIPEEVEAANTEEIARLTKELRRAKLGQIALLADHYSGGKSRLLIRVGASAEPKVGVFERVARQMPFITVYPVSSPIGVKLEGVGKCDLLGAVALGVEATATEGDDKDRGVVAKPDVYLLAYGMNDGWLGEARLISVTVDDEGRVKFDVALRTLADHSEHFDVACLTSTTLPYALVQFPGEGEVSEDNPAWRSSVRFCWRTSYHFALDLRINMV